MELTEKQQVRLRIMSDDQLLDQAVQFIQTNKTLPNAQISGLENITETAKKFSDIIGFVRHQADKDNKKISEFYRALKTKLEDLWKQIEKDRDFVPENLTSTQLAEYKEFFGLLIAREFIHHLSAENRYRMEAS